MTDPQVFYNREDLWVSPNETYAGEQGTNGALLHPDEAAGQRYAGISADDPVYATKPQQHDLVDGGTLRFPGYGARLFTSFRRTS